MAGRTAAGTLLMLALCEIVSGCAGVTPVAYSEVASSAYLAPNPSDSSGRVPYRYAAQVEWRHYDKVMLDPIVVCRGRDNQFGEMSERDKTALAARIPQRCIKRHDLNLLRYSDHGPSRNARSHGDHIATTNGCKLFQCARKSLGAGNTCWL